MTGDYTKEIKERLAAATPGPWRVRMPYVVLYDPKEMKEPIERDDKATAEFIAYAPTDIANLLAEREVLRESLKFYAEANNYDRPVWTSDPGSGIKLPSIADKESGSKAREALAWKPEK